jgi:triosephosphate isomerase (TIM)
MNSNNRAMLCANWKMNSSLGFIDDYFTDFDISDRLMVSFFAPFVYLPKLQQTLAKSSYALGAQNISAYEAGAHTGEISAAMLAEFGCSQVLVGHSERRNLYLESSELIADKFFAAWNHDITPVLCVGETLLERENGVTLDIIAEQCAAVLNDVRFMANTGKKFVIAYEPVWAIGTGKVPTAEEIQEIHSYIRSLIEKHDKNIANETPILYGGSLNIDNASAIFAAPDVDGGLVGGASLKAEGFKELVRICKKYC